MRDFSTSSIKGSSKLTNDTSKIFCGDYQTESSRANLSIILSPKFRVGLNRKKSHVQGAKPFKIFN
jgi:hypothetical protein